MQNLRDFYTLPEISSQLPHIYWKENSKLKQYIHQLNISDCGEIARHLVTTTPIPDNKACHDGCLNAHLAHISFGVANYPRPHDIHATHKKLKEQYHIDDLAELYQIGLFLLLKPRDFLSNFDPDSSTYQGYWYPTFRKWVRTKFDRRLTDIIRAQKGMVNFNRTNLYLVAHATDAKVIKALKHQNYDPTTYSIYRALRSCLEKANNAEQFDTRNPQPADYAEVLALYRQQQGVPSLGYDQIVSYIARLGIAIRNYDRPPLVSIDIPISGEDLGNSPGLQNESDPAARQNGEDEDPCEYQQQVGRVKTIFTDLLQQLPIDSDRVLLLFNGLNFTQDEVAIQLECVQTTAMRRYERILANLAQDLHQQINPDAPVPALKSERLARIVTQAIEFCQHYYGDPLKNTVINRLKQQSIENDRLLLLFYGLDLTQAQIGMELDCLPATAIGQHDGIMATLAQQMCQQINDKSSFPPLSAENHRIVKQAIAYCQEYYPDLLADTLQIFQTQEQQTRIDRVQSRWQIQFQKATESDGEKINIVGGAALLALLKIINKKS